MSTSSWLMKNGYLRKCLLKKITAESTSYYNWQSNLSWKFTLVSLLLNYISLTEISMDIHLLNNSLVPFYCNQLHIILMQAIRLVDNMHKKKVPYVVSYNIMFSNGVFQSHGFCWKMHYIAAYDWKNRYENRLV